MSKPLVIAIIVVIILIIGLSAALYYYQTLEVASPYQKAKIQQLAQQDAEAWITSKSPTYIFDGYDLKMLAVQAASCSSCFEFTFSFSTRQAGLGDRRGQILAQVITHHEMRIEVAASAVTRAVTDGVYDELAGDYLIRN